MKRDTEEVMCFPKCLNMKGFRIALQTDLTYRKGVACRSLLELKSKISSKFSLNEEFKLFTDDSTEIEDEEFLMSLPQNNLLIVSW